MKMMKFSCFNAHIHSHKQKKTVQMTAEALRKGLEDCSAEHSPKYFTKAADAGPLHLTEQGDTLNNKIDHVPSSTSLEGDCKSEEIRSIDEVKIDTGVHRIGRIMKSQSLGSGLNWKGRIHGGNDLENETDQGFPCYGFHDHCETAIPVGGNGPETSVHGQFQEPQPSDCFQVHSNEVNNKSIFSIGDPELDWKGRISGGSDSENDRNHGFSCDGSHDQYESVVPLGGEIPERSLLYQYQGALPFDSFQLNPDKVTNGLIFSIGDPQISEKDRHELSDTQISGQCAGESSNPTPHTLPVFGKSNSLPNLGTFGKHCTSTDCIPCTRSLDNLNVLGSSCKGLPVNDAGIEVMGDQERCGSVSNNEKNKFESSGDVCCDLYNYDGSAKDWIVPATVETRTMKKIQGESSNCRWDELPSRDFKIKRIEDWVMDLQHFNNSEETIELSTSNDFKVPRVYSALDGLSTARLDNKVNPGTDAAKKYISSLSATATAAQLANHGLVVIPFLSAFVSLRTLNLSGNAIVRITAGALPRGLHILNLSKNNISAIEGLRDLTRLRVLDLSYNRIFKIGHGLAYCSSLKELYLAGNKISEVEGLHRLLKLNVLDLRFNKISTTKCLGQLAANYNSLHAISLEGNPAQKNIGDEQLKKYLQGLLPQLVYFNRQSIKLGASKDVADRSARLGLSSHQIDRGLRSEFKTTRKGSHGASAHKMSSSSIHSRSSQAVATPKPSRGRHGRIPTSGTKKTSHGHHFYDSASKLLNFRPDLSIRRIRSEETVGAF